MRLKLLTLIACAAVVASMPAIDSANDLPSDGGRDQNASGQLELKLEPPPNKSTSADDTDQREDSDCFSDGTFFSLCISASS